MRRKWRPAPSAGLATQLKFIPPYRGFSPALDLAHDRALVPAPQHEMRENRQREENEDSGKREEKQRSEHARDVEPIAGFDDAIRKSRPGAGRARRDLGDDGADER